MATRPFDTDKDDDDALIRQNAANAGVESGSRSRAGPLLLLLLPLLGGGGHGSFHLVLALATTFVTAQGPNSIMRSSKGHHQEVNSYNLLQRLTINRRFQSLTINE